MPAPVSRVPDPGDPSGGPLRLSWHAPPRRRVRPTAVATGVFDLLHVGHVRFLELARAAAAQLLVGVEDDARTGARKGRSRPLLPAAERAELLAALRAVDGVFIVSGPEDVWRADAYASLLAPLGAEVFALTEGDPAEPGKREAARLIGARVVVAPL